jgi:broad specificity phosphatase PhoE
MQQVRIAAAHLQERQFQSFYCSPAGRTIQTAQILAEYLDLTPVVLDDLMEMDFGVREGALLSPRFPRLTRLLWLIRMTVGWSHPVAQGGESFQHVYHRAARVLEFITEHHPNDVVLLVSHTGMINMLLRQIVGRRFTYFDIPPASITEIEINRHGIGRVIQLPSL